MSSFLIAEDGRFVPEPGSPAHPLQYWVAFEEAMRAVQLDLVQLGQAVFPYSRSRRSEDEDIIHPLVFR
jgi:hypothetical protein